ncbi:MAG: cupin domain-containing protein [Oscillospiraceae bacterium]|nr:cupin domain-containing protein [Oscillospiraceae bacterium]
MSYKFTKKNESVTYEAPNHFDVRTTRLHNPGDVNEGRITMGLSHFLPGGGCTFGSNAKESIYYIISGEMDVETEDGVVTMHAGDSFHCGPNTKKGIKNNGSECCQMLVVLTSPN